MVVAFVVGNWLVTECHLVPGGKPDFIRTRNRLIGGVRLSSLDILRSFSRLKGRYSLRILMS